MKYILKTTVFSLFLIAGVVFVLPQHAHALFLDPLFENAPYGPHCLFMDCNNNNNTTSQPSNVDNSVNNSYNNNTGSFNGGSVVGTPTYNYGNNGSTQSQLSVSCYALTTTANVGDSVQWRSSVSGGNGSYYISWTGTDSLSGIGAIVTKTYSYAGTKNASVSVTSGGQSASANCSSTVTIYSYNNNYYPTPTYYYNNQYPNYNYNNNYSYPLSVSCSSNSSYISNGSSAYWTAYASGGNGGFTYSWSGTDGLYGTGNTASAYYNNPGVKTAWVTVYSNGQSQTAQCSNSITVGQSSYYYPQQPIVYNNGLQIACAVDTTSTRIGTPVTWSAEATNTGYPGQFAYSWSGTGGLYGSQSSAVISYTSAGTKSATVTVVGPNGQSQTQKCYNTVTVKSNVVAKAPVKKPVVVQTPPPAPIQEVSAASLFSLANVPWGWVAVLVILVLLGIILYLIFNRKKI